MASMAGAEILIEARTLIGRAITPLVTHLGMSEEHLRYILIP